MTTEPDLGVDPDEPTDEAPPSPTRKNKLDRLRDTIDTTFDIYTGADGVIYGEPRTGPDSGRAYQYLHARGGALIPVIRDAHYDTTGEFIDDNGTFRSARAYIELKARRGDKRSTPTDAITISSGAIGVDPDQQRPVLAAGGDPDAIDALHRGQIRIAYRFADQHSGKFLFVPKIGWHHWDGRRWAPDERLATRRAVIATFRRALADSFGDSELREDVRRCESDAGIRGVLNVAGSLTEFVCAATELDADPYLLNCANGTLDLRTMKLRPHDPTDRITKVTRGAHTPWETGSGAWDKFLDRVLPDADERGFLQRVVGVSLLGKVVEHVLPILRGTGYNGKGTAYVALLHALGDYAATAEPDLFTARDGSAGSAAGQMDLRGRRLVVVSETDKGKRLAEATMKRLTGGDPVKAKYMGQNWVEFPPSHTVLYVSNFLPKVSGDDPAVWRRLRVVPWDVVIPADERDPRLPGRLELEADAILAWAVAGYEDYVARGDRFDEPESVLVATAAYRKDSDAVARFVEDRCNTTECVNGMVRATTGDLHKAWATWAMQDGAEPMSLKSFGQSLDRLGYPASPAANNKRWRERIALQVDEDEGSWQGEKDRF